MKKGSGPGLHRRPDLDRIGRARALELATWSLAVGLALAGCGPGSSPGGNGPGGGHGVVQDPPPPTLGDLAEVGDLVGLLEVTLPSVTPFVLHGTMPVPPRAHVDPPAGVPFQLRGPDGTLYAAQVETVTRWPNAQDGADVVEILARVDRPAGLAPGARTTFQVMYQPHGAGQCHPSVHVTNMLAQEGAISLSARDVFGNEYRTDVLADARSGTGSARTLRSGRVAEEVATHEVLRPVTPTTGANATLPHLMGVHSYLTRYSSEDFVTLDMRVHAAFSGLDPSTTDDDPLGKIYFDALEISVPAGWTVLESTENPYSGPCTTDNGRTRKALVLPIAGGALHVMPPLSQFERRLVIARVGFEARALSALREEGLAFCREGTSRKGLELFSWWHGTFGRWFAQRHPLPSLGQENEATLRQALANGWTALQNQVTSGATGTYPIESGNLGWAHPFGIQHGGMVSGAEIYLFDGADVAQTASIEGLRAAQLRLRMYTDRQPNVLFNADGRHARWSEWVVHAPGGDFLPVWWYNAPMLWASDPFGYGAAPTHQTAAVAAAGRAPAYEAELAAYQPVDWQHLVRYTRNAKVCLWLDNDTLAKEDLRAQAEGFLFGYSNLPQDLYGNIISTGMLSMTNYAAQNPGMGVCFGRGEAWGLDAVLCTYSTAEESWRRALVPWARTLVGMVERGQSSCSGVIQATPQYNVFDSQYRCRQSIEAAIMENALVALRETVFEGADAAYESRLDEVLRRAFYAMVSPYVWSDTHRGPWAMMAVGPFSMDQAPFCTSIPSDGNYGFADHYQSWSSLAYAYELTHDPLFLSKAQEMLGSTNLTADLTADPVTNWQNRAALIQLVQSLEAPGGPSGP